MSIEHKVLGFRPPQGSLAAEAQAAAAKHPEVTGAQPPDPEKLKQAATVDAQRILSVCCSSYWNPRGVYSLLSQSGKESRPRKPHRRMCQGHP